MIRSHAQHESIYTMHAKERARMLMLAQGCKSFRLLLTRGGKGCLLRNGTFMGMSESHIGITSGAETDTIIGVPCVCSIRVLPLSLAPSHTLLPHPNRRGPAKSGEVRCLLSRSESAGIGGCQSMLSLKVRSLKDIETSDPETSDPVFHEPIVRRARVCVCVCHTVKCVSKPRSSFYCSYRNKT
jgi:hypothetical protein